MSTLIPSRDKRTSEELERLVTEAEDIPTVPESLIQIMRVLDDQDSGPADLARVVRLDAPLMAKILRLANSPYYQHPGRLADINRCVAVLGYRTVRQMALTVSVATSLVQAVARTAGRLDYRELWRHSVVVGAMAKELAVLTGHPEPEEVFTAGLLHDIGKYLIEISDAARYDRLIERRSAEGRPLIEMEREEFGFDHAEIGAAFSKVWYLPEPMVETLGGHHGRSGKDAGHPRHVALVMLADYLANTMLPSRSDLGFDPRHVEPAALHRAAGVPLAELESRLGPLREAVDMASAYLSLD